jgi:hypothetical protein
MAYYWPSPAQIQTSRAQLTHKMCGPQSDGAAGPMVTFRDRRPLVESRRLTRRRFGTTGPSRPRMATNSGHKAERDLAVRYAKYGIEPWGKYPSRTRAQSPEKPCGIWGTGGA